MPATFTTRGPSRPGTEHRGNNTSAYARTRRSLFPGQIPSVADAPRAHLRPANASEQTTNPRASRRTRKAGTKEAIWCKPYAVPGAANFTFGDPALA
jgi:hypothetical protein